MAVKCVLSNKNTIVNTKYFPKIMKHKVTGNIWLLRRVGGTLEGLCLVTNTNDIDISMIYVSTGYEDEYEDYNEPVILQNQ